MRLITVILFIITFFISAHIVRAQECHTREDILSAMEVGAARLDATIQNEVYRGEVATKSKDLFRSLLNMEKDFDVSELIVFRVHKMGITIAIAVWFGPDNCGKFMLDKIPTELMDDILMKSGGRSAKTE